jgi:hypothetical protein
MYALCETASTIRDFRPLLARIMTRATGTSLTRMTVGEQAPRRDHGRRAAFQTFFCPEAATADDLKVLLARGRLLYFF